MTSVIPRSPAVMYTAVSRASESAGAVETAVACVDCALEGAPASLSAVYTVAGTVLCRAHAVRERERLFACAHD